MPPHNKYHLEVIFDPETPLPKRHPWGLYHFPSVGDAEGYAQWLTEKMDLSWCAIELSKHERPTHHPVIASTRQQEDFRPVYVSFNGILIGPADDEYEYDENMNDILEEFGEEENPF